MIFSSLKHKNSCDFEMKHNKNLLFLAFHLDSIIQKGHLHFRSPQNIRAKYLNGD